MFDKNIQLLKKVNPFLANLIVRARDNRDNDSYKLENSRSGAHTLAVQKGDTRYFLHSKYDPVHEAQAFIDGFDGSTLNDIDTVVFFGVGLGYHIVEFAKRFRDKYIILLEPDPSIMSFFMETVDIESLNKRRLRKIYVADKSQDINMLWADLLNNTYENLAFITWPAYERMLNEEFISICDSFKQHVRMASINRATINLFQKRWVINSFINMSKNVHNKDIFDVDRSYTTNKPALIVSAGPSLDYELDNLRRIIDNDLAYVFAVGSSIKTLYLNGIKPHATITMDPDESTQATYFEMIEDEDYSTPLIYGTSVGHETLSTYKAKQYYMMMDKDTVSQLFFKKTDGSKLSIVNDAPSIAVTTTQLLSELGFSSIIYVGQNLAYVGNKNYSSGIKYGDIGAMRERDDTLTETEERIKVETIDVDGNTVFTNVSYILMKQCIEAVIARYPSIEFINTTRHGAAIAGTTYVELGTLLEEKLTQPAFDNKWLDSIGDTKLNKDYLDKKISDFNREFLLAKKCIAKSNKLLQELERCAIQVNRQPAGAILDAINKNIVLLSRLDIYKYVLAPINMLGIGSFREKLATIRGSRSFTETLNNFIMTYGTYLLGLDKDLLFIVDNLSKHIFAEIKESIHSDSGLAQSSSSALLN